MLIAVSIGAGGFGLDTVQAETGAGAQAPVSQAAGAQPMRVQTTNAKPAAPQLIDPYIAAEKLTQGSLGHPYMLPPASRARIHECGIEWQAMKMSGAATDKIWRVFATACLTRPVEKTTDTPDPAQ